ncbi:winged helix-turn-helix domain-containing protein [Mesorhizobium sp.]|uniref:winged helix-turn-helix domain-containing protein n=1 Tax=Mesorhizobium sp. TaxID=1871066 RepID=UPI000FE3DF9A|nr:winged helix-turn-helix domain-containing protein [Mesorhizobium sp.]RWN53109.1 MAG: adenylate/guanylate cyclase domain-containing protein [Mesorhizobium sp.]RWN73746.1 MAG: adenylate/guanylate cyclase domain-containing protein [Mesorhizobium sp.]RWN76890.1 MAG: adenylate/guanylate cyclase domain-containing protein [Mesorhizobium sp.]RWN88065.1 MAG: adenylate/guanylate cyclase domain-containing protein [Mesorhizobium sp.]RWO12444.1 MAG: adenylate/guanylate cyclase domain-containing protein 
MNTPAPTRLLINGVVADLSNETLSDGPGNPIDLRPQAFAVLRYLSNNPNRLVTKGELMQSVWAGTAVTDDSLVQCIHEIRRALKDDGHAILKTKSRRGYMLALPEANAAAMPATSRTSNRALQRPLAAFVGSLLIVLAVAAVAGWMLRPLSPGGKPLVAVLPFDVLGEETSARLLGNGLTEEIITDLARFPEFQVIAHDSTETYAGRSIGLAEIAKTLGVGFVVEGSIQRQAGRLRITAQLLDAATGKHLWSDRWDRPDEDLFAIQTEISEQVSNRLGGGHGVIEVAGRIAAHRKPPSDLTAYELYLLGTEKLAKMNRADVEEAIKLLKRAVEFDPGLARAWVELYHAYGVMPSFGADFEANFRLAAEAAERAVMLDPSDAEAHAVLGFSFGDRNDLARAKMEFDTALRMAPNQFEILSFYAFLASSFGEPQRGAEMADRATRLNPNYPMASTRLFAAAYFMAGRYEDALRMQKQMGPENYGRRMWVYRPAALAASGRTAEAKTALAEALKWFPDLTIEGFVSLPDTNEDDRRRLIETMRLAGFPPCAKAEAVARFEKPVHLPECVER